MKYDNRASAAARGYDARWRRLRSRFLAANPLCAYCQRQGIITAATVVDHIEPIAKAPHRRLDPTNLQPLCAPHHDRDKQSEERLGYSTEVGIDGWPVDERHPAVRR